MSDISTDLFLTAADLRRDIVAGHPPSSAALLEHAALMERAANALKRMESRLDEIVQEAVMAERAWHTGARIRHLTVVK